MFARSRLALLHADSRWRVPRQSSHTVRCQSTQVCSFTSASPVRQPLQAKKIAVYANADSLEMHDVTIVTDWLLCACRHRQSPLQRHRQPYPSEYQRATRFNLERLSRLLERASNWDHGILVLHQVLILFASSLHQGG